MKGVLISMLGGHSFPVRVGTMCCDQGLKDEVHQPWIGIEDT
jgi:hypothetical protein